MIRTILTETYGIRHPIASAGMAFVGTVPLVRGVCAAGLASRMAIYCS